jgi:hypothetical protein
MALKVNGQTIIDSSSTYLRLPAGPDSSRPNAPVVGMIRFNTTSSVLEVFSTGTITGVQTSTWQAVYTTGGYSSTPVNGEATYTTPGTSTWICPADVTVVSILCVGGGGGGGGYVNSIGGSGGGGGALAYSNYVSVTPGNSYTVTVGAGGISGAIGNNPGTAGTTSSVKLNETVICQANGGRGGGANGASGGSGGEFFGSGGGNGGSGGPGLGGSNLTSGGGGGAGGYSGAGGLGGSGDRGTGPGSNGLGGAGGGGGNTYYLYPAGGGGGVGIYGQGSSGAGGASLSSNTGIQGGGGSGGTGAAASSSGGTYGGGAGGGSATSSANDGGNGVVRIIWGPGLNNAGRQFPSTNVGAL